MKTWTFINNHHLKKIVTFKTYPEGLDFAVNVGTIAEKMNHHPTILIEYRKVTITIWTHTINGVGPLDYEFTNKCDDLLK